MEIGFRLLLGEDPGSLPACPPAVRGLDGGLCQADYKLCVHFICSCCRPDRCQGLELPSSLASRQTCFSLSPVHAQQKLENFLMWLPRLAWVMIASGLWDDGWVGERLCKIPTQFWHITSKVSVRLGGFSTAYETQQLVTALPPMSVLRHSLFQVAGHDSPLLFSLATLRHRFLSCSFFSQVGESPAGRDPVSRKC